ncbi:40S ribosomal protein S20-1 [Fagus crenata]
MSVRPWNGFEDGVEGGVSVMDANRTRTTNLFANTKPIRITSAKSMTVKALMLVPVKRGQHWRSSVRINNLEGDLVLEVDRSDDSDRNTSLSAHGFGGLLMALDTMMKRKQETMAYAMKPPKQLGPKELQEQIHKIRITFSFKKVKNLEKDNSPPQLCLFLLFCF